MAKAITEIAVGVALVGLDIALPGAGVVIAPWVSSLLIGTASSLILGGLGSLLTSQQPGLMVPETSSIEPWHCGYGQFRTGGVKVYEESTGSSDKYLHRIFVLASHPCENVDLLLMDNQYVPLDTNGNSFNASPRSNPIVSIVRSSDIVTVVVSGTPGWFDGNFIEIQNVTTDPTLNGIFAIQAVGTDTIIYQCGGADVSIVNQGNTLQKWPQYGTTVHMEVAYGNQSASAPPFPGLLTSGDTGSQGLWTAQHLLQGCTAVYLRLQWDPNVYANGIPTPSFIMRGKSNIFDPRDGTYKYTANSALCAADFLTNNIWGFRAEYGTTLPTDALIAAANLCDESTATASGVNEPTYECHGIFTTDADRGTILNNILSSCGGRLTDTGGQYVIQPAAWVTPTLNLGGNDDLPARSFNGYDLLDFGNSSALYVQGNWSCGAWLEFPSGTATGPFIGMCNVGSGDPSAAAPYLVQVTGGPNAWQIEYVHDYGTSSGISGHEYLTFGISSIPSDTWTYVGLSRDSTAKTVTLYTGDGTTVTAIQTLSYGQTPGIEPGQAHMSLGATYSTVSQTSGLENSVLLMRSGYMSDTVWAASDHTAAMSGSPTASGLLIDCDLTQAAPVSVASGVTLTPTITGTTLISGVGVPFLPNTLGAIKWAEKLQSRDLYNGVRGAFTSPINGWVMTDYPPFAEDPNHGYSVDQNLADDGGDADGSLMTCRSVSLNLKHSG